MAIPTINTIKNSLATFASYHLQLKRFQLSFFEQFDAFSEQDIQFPLLFAIPQDVSMQNNINSFTMRIYCVDLIQSDRSNEVDIINDTLLILRDLRNWLQLADNGLNILNNPTAFPVNNFLISNTIGWYFDVEVEATADNSECSIPFSANFLLSGNSCTYNYVVPYLTCDTLSSCQTIINIENDITNIYSILSGTTGNTGNYLSTSGGTLTGGVTGTTFTGTFIGDGSQLTGITAAIVTGLTWNPNTLTVTSSDGSSASTTISAFTAFNYSDGTQQNGRVLTSDANGNASWEAPAVGSLLAYFFNNLSAGTSTYYQAKTDPQTGALQTITNNNVINLQQLAGFITDVGEPGTTFIPAGIVNLHIHAANTNSGRATQLFFSLHKRTSGGTETTLGVSNNTPTIGSGQASYTTDLSITATTLNVTDRLVVKIFANVTGGGTAPNIALYTADNTLSRVELPSTIVSLANYVPYTGATTDVNLGGFGLTATTLSATTYQGLPVYERLNDNDIVNFYNYCGVALSGTSQNSPTWDIARISWSSTTPTTQTAVGAWSGRTSLIYT